MTTEVIHYAVWKGKPYMETVHTLNVLVFHGEPPINHQLTIIRGRVTCRECRRMMGMPVQSWEKWSKQLSSQVLSKMQHAPWYENAVSRVLIRFDTASGRSVFWGCWYDSNVAKAWADEIMSGNPGTTTAMQNADDPFIGYELVWTNMIRKTVTPEVV